MKAAFNIKVFFILLFLTFLASVFYSNIANALDPSGSISRNNPECTGNAGGVITQPGTTDCEVTPDSQKITWYRVEFCTSKPTGPTTSATVDRSDCFTFYQNDIQKIVKQKDDLLQQLQLKNTELERFAYITSHDLKEPVKNIEGFAGILKRDLAKEGITERLQIVNMIYDSAKRMTTLIDSILKFSRLEKDGLVFESIDLNTLIHEFKQTHSHFLKDRKATIQHDQLPQIQGNKTYLSLLFQNLIENALKYNESDIPSVKIVALREKNNIHLIINDNGIGIKEEYATYVFEPFRRLHNRSKYKGAGLGLAICKKIVENHSGKIWVESGTTGSQFNILLPANEKHLSNLFE